MTEIKHAPGPWTVGYFVNGSKDSPALAIWSSETQPGQRGNPICLISPISRRNDQDDINALLIAAAPELLEALETIVEHLAESHATKKDADHYGDDPEECSYCKSIAAARAAIDKATKGV